jgi:hypothetical protein
VCWALSGRYRRLHFTACTSDAALALLRRLAFVVILVSVHN